jgi:hypothetical protein
MEKDEISMTVLQNLSSWLSDTIDLTTPFDGHMHF